MDWLEWLQTNIIPLVSLVVTIVLVIINGVYIYLTKKTLDTTVRQSKLVYNPVIGIGLGPMMISKVFGPSRRQLSIGLNLTNVGNAPAIEVLVDAEIILQYSDIGGEKTIPGCIQPESIPFVRPGEEIKGDPSISPNFGNTCVAHVLADCRESHRLNVLRIETDPTKEAYNASMLRVCVCYRNNIDQYFESTYETYVCLDKIPEENESAKIQQVYVPRPKFHARPVSKEEIDKKISERNSKRDLCGW